MNIKANPKDKILQKMAKQDIPKYRIDRLRELEADLQILLSEATVGQEQEIYKTLKDVATVSQVATAKRFKNTLDLVFDRIASRKLEKILSSDWFGATWSERLWKDRAVVGEKITDILSEGIPQGYSMQKMTRELQQATGQSFNNAFRLIRTESSFVDSSVALANYEEAEKELGIEYYQYDAFLDSRTSEICRELDKQIIPIDEAEIGVNFPPMHPNCRSTCVLDTSSIEDNLDDLIRDKELKENIDLKNKIFDNNYKEFKSMENIYSTSFDLAISIIEKVPNLTKTQQIKYARDNISESILKSYVIIGKLSDIEQKTLLSETSDIKLSVDTIIKNKIEHPEIKLLHYENLNNYIANADYILQKNDKNIIYFKKEGKLYQFVIKTTDDKKENFVTTYHFVSEKQLKKDLKRYKRIK